MAPSDLRLGKEKEKKGASVRSSVTISRRQSYDRVRIKWLKLGLKLYVVEQVPIGLVITVESVRRMRS